MTSYIEAVRRGRGRDVVIESCTDRRVSNRAVNKRFSKMMARREQEQKEQVRRLRWLHLMGLYSDDMLRFLPPRHPARRAARRRELLAEKSTVEHAMAILSTCERGELRDHAFGDCEVHWEREGIEIGSGYFGGEANEVSVLVDGRRFRVRFTGPDADRLRDAGRFAGASRNDSTGPLRFREGVCLPGLSLGGVLDELTSPPSCEKGGEHRWLLRGGYEDGDKSWVESYYRCRDCAVRAGQCAACDDAPAYPRNADELCPRCLAARAPWSAEEGCT